MGDIVGRRVDVPVRGPRDGTGDERRHRRDPGLQGRGLGLLVKQHSLARAAAAGITLVTTQNDDTNAPMLAINRKLGYRPRSVGCTWLLER